jgi:hypothetical protein
MQTLMNHLCRSITHIYGGNQNYIFVKDKYRIRAYSLCMRVNAFSNQTAPNLFCRSKTKLCLGIRRSQGLQAAEGVLEFPANGIADQEVDRAVDGEEQMADSGKDIDPLHGRKVYSSLCKIASP